MSGTPSSGRATRVRRTGIALVHAGELVLPAEGSGAEADAVARSDRTVVHYHFPVEIEVIDLGSGQDEDSLVALTLERLLGGLQSEEG